MLKIYNRQNEPLAYFEDYNNLHITHKIDMDDKTLEFDVSIRDFNDIGIELEGYIETEDDKFVIREIRKKSNGTASVIAQKNVETLEGKAFKTFETVEKTIAEALPLAFSGTGFTLGTVASSVSNKRRTLRLTNTSSFEVMKQAAATYRIEYKINCSTKVVDVYEEVGSDKGAYATDELNLKTLEVSSNTHTFYTELEAYGKDGMTFESINQNKNYVTNYQYSSKSKRYIWKDERYTVKESLLEDAIAKLNDMSKPYTSYSADIVDFAKLTPDYDLLAFEVGDTITLIDTASGTREKQRIVEISSYPDSPDRNQCVLANTTLTFEELSDKYNSAATTIENITSDNGTVNGSTINSINSSQIADFNNAVANHASITTLDSQYVNVSGRLTAAEADIGTLTANVGEFETLATNKFTAVEATIGDLTAGKIDAGFGRIDTLESTYANIKHVLAGNVGAGEVTTIVLNATNSSIDSQFIRNLVAQNVTVADLLAGKISTSKFLVGSDSGNLSITDNTILIKDDQDHPRVQIGEDQSGNYSIVIYDATGQGQLFNENGITESGISDGLIKNAKIANDANISAGKLDIQSLFTAMNGSSYSLKANKIYLDNEGQSLSVAFTEMSSDVSGAVSTAQNAESTAQSALAAIQGISTLDALSAMLSNDAHTVHTYNDGTGGDYTNAWTKITVYLGDVDVNRDTVFMVRPSDGITGTWNPSTYIYKVNAMANNDEYVDFEGVYGSGERYLLSRNGNNYTTRSGNQLTIPSGGSHITKRFSLSKAPDGHIGVSYDINASVPFISRNTTYNEDFDETITYAPESVNFTLIENDNGVMSSVLGFFYIYESNDYVHFTQKYESASPETVCTYTPTVNSALKAIKCIFKNIDLVELDSQIVNVIGNADSLKSSILTTHQHVATLEASAERFEVGFQDIDTKFAADYANDLAYQFNWSIDGDNVTLTAHVYAVDPDTLRRTEVTNNYPDNFFYWTTTYQDIQNEGDSMSSDVQMDVPLGSGKTITINTSQLGLTGNVDGWFAPFIPAYLTSRTGKYYTTRNGNKLMTITY